MNIRKAVILPQETWQAIEEIRFSGRYKSEMDCLRAIIGTGIANIYNNNDIVNNSVIVPNNVIVPIYEKKEKNTKKEKKDFDPNFDVFWKSYPKRVAKPAAVKAWAAAIKRASPEAILAGLGKHSFSLDEKYIPMPSTWLNQDRWNDEATKAPVEKSYWDMTQEEREKFDAEHIQRLSNN